MPSSSDFDPVAAAKRLLRVSRSGALATLQKDGGNPFCSLVNTASLPDGSPLLLISRLAVHTQNLLADAGVSLLLSERGAEDPLTLPRVSLLGHAEPVAEAELDGARMRYLAAHPQAEAFVGFTDFSLWRIAIARAHLVAGFGRIVDLPGETLLIATADAADLLAAEAGAVDHMNRDHADAIRLYATRLLGAADGDWRLTGLDPEGADLALGSQTLRLNFPQPVMNAASLRQVLVVLAREARQRG